MPFDLKAHTAKLALGLIKEGQEGWFREPPRAPAPPGGQPGAPEFDWTLGGTFNEPPTASSLRAMAAQRAQAAAAAPAAAPAAAASAAAPGAAETSAPVATPTSPAAPLGRREIARQVGSPELRTSFLEAMTPETFSDPNTMSFLSGIVELDKREGRSDIMGERQGNILSNKLTQALQERPELSMDPAFQKLYTDTVNTYKEQFGEDWTDLAMKRLEQAQIMQGMIPGVEGAAPPAEAEAPTPEAPPAAPPAAPSTEAPAPIIPPLPRRHMYETFVLPQVPAPLPPLPTGGKPAPGPDLRPQPLAGPPRGGEKDVRRIIQEEMGGRPLAAPEAQAMGMWSTPVSAPQPEGPRVIRITPRAPGLQKLQALQSVMDSIGLFQGAMDKTASVLAQSAFEALVQDMSNWAQSGGAAGLEKVAEEAIQVLGEDEDKEAVSKLAQVDALGRIMAASHVAWLIKMSGGGSELSVEEQIQGRSYNNPTGQHPVQHPGYDATSGRDRDASSLELPIGNHQPGAH